MPWTTNPCVPCRDPICVSPETCRELDLWVKNIPISRPALIEIHPQKIKQAIPPPKIEEPQPAPKMKPKIKRIDGKFMFSLIKDFLSKNPDSTRNEIYAGIPEFKKFKRPDSSLYNIVRRYGRGQIISSKKNPYRLRLKEEPEPPEPITEPIAQIRIPNLYTGNLSELIEIDCGGWNLK